MTLYIILALAYIIVPLALPYLVYAVAYWDIKWVKRYDMELTRYAYICIVFSLYLFIGMLGFPFVLSKA